MTIPKRLADSWGLRPGSRLFWKREGERAILSKEPPPPLDLLLRRLGPRLGRRVLAVVLYGSFATGRYRPGESDIDLLLLTEDRRCHGELDRIFVGVEREIEYEHIFGPLMLALSDARALWEAGDPFFREVVKGGVPLYGGASLRHLLGPG